MKLLPHPEGGYYRESYRAQKKAGDRSFLTIIYFLLEGKQFSRLHRIKSDEVWHFFTGSPVVLSVLDAHGKFEQFILGDDLEKGETLQAVASEGAWFGAYLKDTSSYALLTCSVSPGFDFRDLEFGDRQKLITRYPRYEKLITKLTK